MMHSLQQYSFVGFSTEINAKNVLQQPQKHLQIMQPFYSVQGLYNKKRPEKVMLREWRLPFSYTRAKKASSGLEVNSRVRCVADAAPAFTAFEGQRDDQLLCSFLFLHLRRLRRPFSCQSFLRQPIDNIKGSLNIKLFGLFWPLVQVTRKLAKNPLDLALFAELLR